MPREKPVLSLDTLGRSPIQERIINYKSPTMSSSAKHSKASSTKPFDASPSLTRSRSDSISSTTSQASAIATPPPNKFLEKQQQYLYSLGHPLEAKRNTSKDPAVLAADIHHLCWVSLQTRHNPIRLSICRAPTGTDTQALDRTLNELMGYPCTSSTGPQMYSISFNRLYHHLHNNRIHMQLYNDLPFNLIKACCQLAETRDNNVFFFREDPVHGFFMISHSKIRHLPVNSGF